MSPSSNHDASVTHSSSSSSLFWKQPAAVPLVIGRSLSAGLLAVVVSNALAYSYRKLRGSGPCALRYPAMFSALVFALSSSATCQFTVKRQQNILNAIETLNRGEIGNMHYLRLDSVAPPIPYDHFTEQGELDAQRLMREHSNKAMSLPPSLPPPQQPHSKDI
eukprot:GHVS01108348.1.p1 GENE.GHVS01108348.1~~GHVS01108348.1.p1  ORF type:complete len:163 (+),score=26.20 GHVS01108348.1:98-586(+)